MDHFLYHFLIGIIFFNFSTDKKEQKKDKWKDERREMNCIKKKCINVILVNLCFPRKKGNGKLKGGWGELGWFKMETKVQWYLCCIRWALRVWGVFDASLFPNRLHCTTRVAFARVALI